MRVMNVNGSPLQNAALAFLNQQKPALRKLGLGDLADLAAKQTAAPVDPPKFEPAPTEAPTRPLRPGTRLDIKV